MIERGRGGTILGVTSAHDRMPWAGVSHFAASKGGQRLFLESIAKEPAPQGIRVVAVSPGAVGTPLNEEMLSDPDAPRAVEVQIPMERIGRVDEIAREAAWLASDQASYVTGATLPVDRGHDAWSGCARAEPGAPIGVDPARQLARGGARGAPADPRVRGWWPYRPGCGGALRSRRPG